MKRLERQLNDWELRREDFAVGGLDREMGDQLSAALADPRSIAKAGLEVVTGDQNQQLGDDGERVPRMRPHAAVSKRGKSVGNQTWPLYVEDRRGESRLADRRKRTSARSGTSRRRARRRS